jgi:cytochrome c oxidase subunit 2
VTQGASTLAPGGPGAEIVAGLAWVLIAVAAVACLVVTGLVIAGARRRRGTLAEHLPADARGGTMWIHVGGLLVPAVVLTAAFILAERAMGRVPGSTHAATSSAPKAVEANLEPTIEVTGHQWWWQVRYRSSDLTQEFVTANEIHIPVGRPVRIVLLTSDVIHSFWVPALHPKKDLISGKVNAIVLQADRPGVYLGACAEYCGDEHARMAFTLVADPPPQYDAWLAHERAYPAAASDPDVVRGRAVFLGNACAFCHTVRGTSAHGIVAPDLTHLASRPTLGAGAVPNTRPMLQAWIVNAPAMKPGTQMPAFPQLDGPSLKALTAYLESLR